MSTLDALSGFFSPDVRPERVARLTLAALDVAAEVDERRLRLAQGSVLIHSDRIRELVAALEGLYPGVLASTRRYHASRFPQPPRRRNKKVGAR